MPGLTVAIDVGGTKLVGALLDGDGIRHRVERATPGSPGAADPGSAALRDLANELAGSAGTGEPVAAVGVGCCEYVSDDRLTSREVLAWTEQPAAWLPAVFSGARVVVESDVRCGLLAECRLGAARELGSAVFVSWGTGLSSALLLDGAIWSGSRGRAIALGELPGPLGLNLEQFASGAGMAARWGAASGRPGRGTRALVAAADHGESTALAIAATAGQALADALAALVHLLDPERLVLGGGMGCADTAARRALLRHWERLGNPAELVVAELGPDGPLLGAGLAAGWRG
ncbi:ROK family protein [Microlunatus aurantiacus]|uniref:ROK family protein n=1 Tax=Microlunatus aurantiacus TaxID=446786 RepID=A0ABP7DE66_9ACTN